MAVGIAIGSGLFRRAGTEATDCLTCPGNVKREGSGRCADGCPDGEVRHPYTLSVLAYGFLKPLKHGPAAGRPRGWFAAS